MADIDKLIEARDRARNDLATIGDLRPGSLQENFTRCGKPNCRCAGDDAARHPGTVLIRYLNGKTTSTRLRRDEVEEAQALVDEYQRFRGMVTAFVAASEALAEARRKDKRAAGVQKKGLPRAPSRRPSRHRSRPTSSA